jgi:SAM-dependent methyltransferase
MGSPITLLDIGCGRGFDDSVPIQQSLAARADPYIGVEPDCSVPAPACCHVLHRCTLEQAPVTPGSVDLAFAVFVFEHLSEPRRFVQKVREVLKEGGVFWGFTVDARSLFAAASRLMERSGLKDRYLRRLHGDEAQRYRNYPTHYSANTPRQIRQLADGFRSCETCSLHSVGQFDFVTPRPMRPAARLLDRLIVAGGLPGANLVFRLEK